MRQIFLDTETTGLDAANGDRLIEIGGIEMMNRRLTERTFHQYVNPGRASHEEAFKVHGIRDDFLATQPPFEAICDDFIAFVQGAELIIHNAAFDVGFIDAELRRLGRPPLARIAGRITDSLLLAREVFPGKGNSLDALCKRLEVDNSHRTRHGALLDAGLLAEVYIRLTRGQDSLVIDASAGGAAGDLAGAGAERIDLTTLALKVHRPTDAELAAHQALLAEVDKASGGKLVWKPAVETVA